MTGQLEEMVDRKGCKCIGHVSDLNEIIFNEEKRMIDILAMISTNTLTIEVC